MKGAFLAIYEKIKASIQHAINNDAEDWSIMPSDVAKEIDGGFKAYAEGLEEQAETLRAEQSIFMQTQAQTLAEHVFDEAQHLTQAQANEIAKVEGKVDKTDFKDHLEDDERHLTFSDRVEINSVKDKASAEDLQRHISNPDVHYPIEVTQEYTDVAIDKAKAELLEVIAQGGGSASVDLSVVIDRISDVEGALTAHKNDPSIHFKIEETKAYTDAKLQEAKGYSDVKLQEAKTYTNTEIAKIKTTGSNSIFLYEDIRGVEREVYGWESTHLCYLGNNIVLSADEDKKMKKHIVGNYNPVTYSNITGTHYRSVNSKIVAHRASDGRVNLIRDIDNPVSGLCANVYVDDICVYGYIDSQVEPYPCFLYIDSNDKRTYKYEPSIVGGNKNVLINSTQAKSICYIGNGDYVYESLLDSKLYVQNIETNSQGTYLGVTGRNPRYVGEGKIIYNRIYPSGGGLSTNFYIKSIYDTRQGIVICSNAYLFMEYIGGSRFVYTKSNVIQNGLYVYPLYYKDCYVKI